MPQLNMNDVAIALEVNEAAGVAGSVREAIARMPGGPGALRPLGDGFLIYGGPGAFINRAAGLGMPSEVTADQLDQVEAFYKELDAVPTVDLCPYAHATLRRQLRERGYVIQKFKEVLYRPLGAEDDFAPLPGIDTLLLDRQDEGQLQRIAKVIETGFWEGKPPPEGRVHNTLRLLRQSAATTFAAIIDGEWVGGGVVATSDGGPAALFAASTRPEFRRRGVQAALIRARLAFARSQGATLATIQCAPGIATRRNAERQGFQCAYTKVEMVLLDRDT